MGFKIGMPCLKLSNKEKDAKHSGVFKKVVSEALEERYGKDKDIDRSKSEQNKYFGISTAEELVAYSEKIIEDINAERRRYNKTNKGKAGFKVKKKIKEDAVVMCAIIIKPPAEMMQQLSDEEQDRLLEDALEKVKEIVDAENVKSAVIHKDELVRHMHIFWIPITPDGRLCAKEMHNKIFLNTLNSEMPKHLRSKGWDIDDCDAYDEDERAKRQMKKRSGKSSKVFKHEMDSLTKELAEKKDALDEREQALNKQEQDYWKHSEKLDNLLKAAEEMYAETDRTCEQMKQACEADAQQAKAIVEEAKQTATVMLKEAGQILSQAQADIVIDEYRRKAVEYYSTNPEPKEPEQQERTIKDFLSGRNPEEEYQQQLDEYQRQRELYTNGKQIVTDRSKEQEELEQQRQALQLELQRQRQQLAAEYQRKKKQLDEQQKEIDQKYDVLEQENEKLKVREHQLDDEVHQRVAGKLAINAEYNQQLQKRAELLSKAYSPDSFTLMQNQQAIAQHIQIQQRQANIINHQNGKDMNNG